MTDAEHDAQDAAWLEARERRAPVLPPIDPARAAAYDELQALIAELPDESAPAGWEAGVLAALPASTHADASPAVAQLAEHKRPVVDSPARRRPGRWVAMATTLAAAAALAVWIQRPGMPEVPTEGTPITRVIPHAGSRAAPGSEAAVGDTLHVEVTASGAGELRVYRDDQEVVLRCPGPSRCVQDAQRLSGELRLAAPGQYRAVYLTSTPAQAQTSTLANDLATCGCRSRVAVPVVAR